MDKIQFCTMDGTGWKHVFLVLQYIKNFQGLYFVCEDWPLCKDLYFVCEDWPLCKDLVSLKSTVNLGLVSFKCEKFILDIHNWMFLENKPVAWNIKLSAYSRLSSTHVRCFRKPRIVQYILCQPNCEPLGHSCKKRLQTKSCYSLQITGRWESNINVCFPFCVPRNETDISKTEL